MGSRSNATISRVSQSIVLPDASEHSTNLRSSPASLRIPTLKIILVSTSTAADFRPRLNSEMYTYSYYVLF